MATDEEIRDALDGLTDEDLGRLHVFAGRLLALSGVPASRMDTHQAVHEAITLVLAGTRNWDPERVSILGELFGVIKSLVSHQAEKDKQQWTELVNPDESVSDGEGIVPAPNQRTVERTVIEEEIRTKFRDEAETVLARDAVGLEVFGLLLNEESSSEICSQLQIDKKQLNVIKQRLRRKLRDAGLGEF